MSSKVGAAAAGSSLRVAANVSDDRLHLSIGDDGAGICWEKVAERASARGLPFATQQELEAALFADGLSARDVVSDVSGRGVGLAAVRATVAALGGTITVSSIAGPGIGCTNFALYNNEKQFGITCHHMLPKVDTGNIIAVSYFPIEQNDSVWTLTQRCYVAISELFVKVMSELHESGKFATSSEKWQRVAYRRVELNALCKITSDMSEEEVNRRIRAPTFPNMPGAYIELYGHKFNYTA